MAKRVSFEEQLRRLEEIVGSLEDGNLPLEEALRLFEDGIKASRECHRLLDQARQRVQKLIAEEGGTFRLEMLEE